MDEVMAPTNRCSQRPHCEASSVCLPPHPVVAYLSFVRHIGALLASVVLFAAASASPAQVGQTKAELALRYGPLPVGARRR